MIATAAGCLVQIDVDPIHYAEAPPDRHDQPTGLSSPKSADSDGTRSTVGS